MMIEVKLGDNLNRKTIMVDNEKTVKEVLEDNDVNYASTTIHMDGVPLSVSELNSTFAAMGITDKCYLLSVTKLANA